MPYQPWQNPYQPNSPYQPNYMTAGGTYQMMQQPVNGIIKVNGPQSAMQVQLPPNSTSQPMFDANFDGKNGTFYVVSTDGTGINIIGAGYYDLESSLTFTPTATGPVTIQFYQDGMALPGATMTAQGTAAEPIGLYVTSMPRNCGCDCNSMITATVSAAGTANNFSTVIRKD